MTDPRFKGLQFSLSRPSWSARGQGLAAVGRRPSVTTCPDELDVFGGTNNDTKTFDERKKEREFLSRNLGLSNTGELCAHRPSVRFARQDRWSSRHRQLTLPTLRKEAHCAISHGLVLTEAVGF